MSNVISFRNPDTPLEGEARGAALARYREILPVVVSRALSDAFDASWRVARCGDLSGSDLLPLFLEAMRAELAKSDL